MAEAEVDPQAPVAPPPEPEPVPVVEEEVPPSADAVDRKRKHEDLEGGGGENGAEKTDAGEAVAQEANGVGGSEEAAGERADGGEVAAGETDPEGGDAKRQKVDGEADGLVSDGDQQMQSNEVAAVANGQLPTFNEQQPENEPERPAANQQEDVPSNEQQPTSDLLATSQKIEVPNSRVGVLIGKAGETIRFLQFNTGAKIQIQRDIDVDPHAGVRSVELVGPPDSIKKAEQLIKDVMAEADAGGSPALVARGFGTLQPGSEQLELKVPNEKVGMIIGKGGETIKNLQTRSGARIQLIPQHLPEGDSSKERTVRISGNKKQIETATDMIKEVMNQGPGRPSPLSRPQHAYRPHGPTAPPQWGARPPMQPGTGYDYQQRGPYQSQAPHYPPSYGGYAQQQQQQQQHQPAPRGNFGTGWEQRPTQAPPQAGYNYYGQAQGGTPMDVQQSGPPMTASGVGGPAPASANYYGQPQSSGYGQPTHYPQQAPTQPSYGQGYGEAKYDSQAPSTQQVYGQPPVNTQPQYPQQGGGPQSGYQQQPYTRPVYGGPPPQVQPQAYGPPAGNPPDPYQGQYQGQNPPQNYASGGSQQYPYGSGASQAYGSTPGTQDGYMQQTSGGYPQYGAQMTPGYAQAGQAAPAYQQGSQASYGQYPQPQQQVYGGEQPAQANTVYGYQGGPPANSAYGATASGYAAPPAAAGYVQAPANTTAYDQSAGVAPQAAYAAVPPAGAQAAFAKSLSPQPQPQSQPQPQAQQTGYVQYDSSQPQVYSHN